MKAGVAHVALVAHPETRGGDDELSTILDRIEEVFTRYVAFPSDEARWAVVGWVVHCWVVAAFDTTPRLAVLSPEKGSGKTRVLEILVLLCPNAMLTVQISPAAVFSLIEQGPITLLMDESDTYLGHKVAEKHEDLRGLVNAGYRRGATVPRVEMTGKTRDVRQFPAFAPVALAGIGDLPDTIIDRSIVISMKRRAPNEQVESFRQRRAERETADLKDWLQAWSDANVDRIEDDEPDLPEGIVDRAADVWEPLIVIGDRAGGEWSMKMRRAAVVLNQLRQSRDPSLGVRLLTDVRELFTEHNVDRFSTDHLLELLAGMDESPWGDIKGRPVDARRLARWLKPYEVRPGDHRFGDTTKKGYLLEDFYEAFNRYLPPPLPTPHERQQAQQGEVLDTEDYEAKYPELFSRTVAP